MEIGEATHGIAGPMDSGSTTTVSVPDGEVWKFTVVSLSGPDGGAPANEHLSVEVDDSENLVTVASSGYKYSPAVGGYGSSADSNETPSGVRSMIVDGSEADLVIRNTDEYEMVGYWAATRVS